MITKDQKFEKKSAHNRYTDTYIEILSTYKDQLNKSFDQKIKLKEDFFHFIQFIMRVMVVVFAIVLIGSVILMSAMAFMNLISLQFIVGAATAIISSFVSLLLGIIKLPKIIAKYLFDKEENNLMEGIIKNIQIYELNATRYEAVKEKASIDAINNASDDLIEDVKTDFSDYKDPTDQTNDVEQQQSLNNCSIQESFFT